jgi:hypothetical protein
MDFLSAVAGVADPRRGVDADAVAGALDDARGGLQRAGVGAVPDELLRDHVAAGDRAADGADGVGKRGLPALAELYSPRRQRRSSKPRLALTSLARSVMQVCFLQERHHWPYTK